MSAYNEFAEVYDLFMEDVDYPAWCRYVEEIISQYGVKPRKILDTACGTGNVTIPMSILGYEMWGLDISGDMLAIAENKARAARQKIKFLNQDMSEMNVREKFDAVLCMCDGVNYIIDEVCLEDFFINTYNALVENGVFVFDVSSYFKLCSILGSNTFHDERNNTHYIWNNNFDETSETIEMDLLFFVPQGSLYRKFEEHHIQKAYRSECLVSILKKCGFRDVRMFDAFSLEKPGAESERIFFSAIK